MESRKLKRSKEASTRSADSNPGSARKLTVILAALLFGLVTAVFSPALRAGFLDYDDPGYVTFNPHVRTGLTPANLSWALIATEQYNWHPVTWMSHQIDSHLFRAQAWGHHLTSILLHAANSVLLFLLFRRMTSRVWPSFLVAALFGLHPLRVESVVWISERKDVLSGLFFMLTLWGYLRFVESARPAKISRWYWLAVGFYSLGLMSKPMLVTVPFVLLLLDYWPLNRFGEVNAKADARPGRLGTATRLVVEKIPFLLLSLGSSIITLLVQERGGAIIPVARLPIGFRIENAIISYARYLGKMVWPADLAVFYPAPAQWPAGQLLIAVCLLLAISVATIAARRRSPYLGAGWWWFVGMLLPVIGLVQMGAQAMADRYTYLPSIGLVLAVTWSAREALSRLGRRVTVLEVISTALLMTVCAGLTVRQIGFWRDTETLAQRALTVTRDNHIAHNLLGLALLARNQPAEGMRQFQEAMRIKPTEPDSYAFLGRACLDQERLDEAIHWLQQGLALDPRLADGHRSLAQAFEKRGNTDDAQREWERHLQLNPRDAEARNELGSLLLDRGQIEPAMAELRRALALKPAFAEAHNNLGVAFCRTGQWDEGLAHLEQAVKLKPDSASHHNNLGIALAKKNRIPEAISQFKEALRLQPNFPAAERQLKALTEP